MASPPFSLNTAVPGDSDVVSQFPLLDRTLRDIIQSWILANHDTNGNHVVLKMPYQGSTPATPAASIRTVYVDSVGRLKVVNSDGTLHFVGVPPGNINFTAASSIPAGWLVADGSAVSRTTYSDLFTALGTTYGVGDGSTTFNVPNINGRVIAGEDNSAGVLTAAGGMSGTTRGSTGGSQTQAIVSTDVPSIISVNVAQAISVRTTVANVWAGGSVVSDPNTGGVGNHPSNASPQQITSTDNNSISVTSPAASTSPKNVQPTIVMKAIIKT